MSQVYIRPELLYAWHGQSLLIVNGRGECAAEENLSGFYFRETRYLRLLRLTVNGARPWLSEAAWESPSALHFDYVHPELEEFGGGGTGQATDEVSTDARGIPFRALNIQVRYRVGIAGLRVSLTVTNHSLRTVAVEIGWELAADFADIIEAHGARREQQADVTRDSEGALVRYRYAHDELPYATAIRITRNGEWRATDSGIASQLILSGQESFAFGFTVDPCDYRDPLGDDEVAERERRWLRWRDGLTRITTPGNALAADIVARNLRDFASFPLLHGAPDEWLALQAGVPVYPALFGRDTLTAGWQGAVADGGQSLDASLTLLGRLQGMRIDDWTDEEPGRIPFQIRQGPLARLNLNPYAVYYADFASPLMFVVALAHLYSWKGDKAMLDRHWDVARRVLDWAREYGDRDGDGYLEYLTRSTAGPKNQGWKDSGDAIVYEDGTPVRAPIATAEVQGYWFAAQQLFAVLSWVRGAEEDAKGHWRAAMDLKERFNRDWWVEPDRCVALALDRDKRLVRGVASNAGHCLATGIVSDDHLPALVERLFTRDMFSGWGIRTLSTEHVSYNPVSYHLGGVWAVENATIAFGLRRFGFDTRAVQLSRALFDLAALYPDYRIPECVGGYARGERPSPGAYPRANVPQLWNAGAFSLLVHSLLGLQPVGPLELLVVDPVLPTWLPEITLHDLRIAGATATIRFWRDPDGVSHAEVLRQRGTLRLAKQPPPESLTVGVGDRFGAFIDGLWHR